jgi:hypothetical protein
MSIQTDSGCPCPTPKPRQPEHLFVLHDLVQPVERRTKDKRHRCYTAYSKTKDAADGKKTMLKLTFPGLAAALCTTASFVPQVVKTWKTRSTADISLGMYLVLVFGTVLWLAYGCS